MWPLNQSLPLAPNRCFRKVTSKILNQSEEGNVSPSGLCSHLRLTCLVTSRGQLDEASSTFLSFATLSHPSLVSAARRMSARRATHTQRNVMDKAVIESTDRFIPSHKPSHSICMMPNPAGHEWTTNLPPRPHPVPSIHSLAPVTSLPMSSE